MRAKDLGNLLLLLALLGGLVWFAQAGGDSCAGAVANLAGVPEPPDPEQVRAALDAARDAPVAGRLDVHLEWIAQGSPLARASLESWLVEFPPGALTSSQVDKLADVALAWPDERLRKAAAGVLLANAPSAESAPAWRAVRGVATEADLAKLPGSAWAAALGPPALPALLQRPDDTALRQLLRAHPDLRRQAIPALIDGLPARHATLVAVAGTDLGADAERWRDWWSGVERSLERLAD